MIVAPKKEASSELKKEQCKMKEASRRPVLCDKWEEGNRLNGMWDAA